MSNHTDSVERTITEVVSQMRTGRTNDAMGIGLQAAQLHALLEIADALRELTEVTRQASLVAEPQPVTVHCDSRLTPDDFAKMLDNTKRRHRTFGDRR